nr:ankyrin repeat domain-containing protein [Dactylosporangium fulvum]
MIGRATERRLAGDWRGACAAAGVDVDVDLAAIKQDHGAEVAARVEEELRHLVPDLLRWHLPRRPGDGLLHSGLWSPLALFPDAHALVAHSPSRIDLPQRITLRFESLDDAAMTGVRDDTLLLRRDRWDSRCTAELLARCGGVTRLPFFGTDGERLTGAGPEGLVERVVRLDESGRHAEAWTAAGFDLEVLLFDPEWSRDRIDPAAFDAERGANARRAAVDRSLAWLRPVHTALADAARRAAAHVADCRRNAPSDRVPLPSLRYTPSGYLVARQDIRRVMPGPVDVDDRSGLMRIDVRGRCIVLDRLDSERPRARLVASVPYGRVDETRRRAEVAAFGLELAHVPRIPHVLARRPAELTALMNSDVHPDELHPLVHAALFPGRPAPLPVAPPVLRDTIRVRCNRATHEVLMRDGVVVMPHSPVEVERELMIRALGGQVQGCVAAHDGWRDPAVRMPRRMRGLRAELMAIVRHGDGSAVAAALDRGLDPHVRDEQGRTLLHLMPWLSDVDLLPRLLDAGLDIDVRDENGETPLHAAVDHGTPDLVRALLAAGADPRARSNHSYPRMAAWTTRRDLDFLREADLRLWG